MPPDRTRAENAQGRQKACTECVKGKRKCDLSQPTCSRCRRQQLQCAYPPQPPIARPKPTCSTQYETVNSQDSLVLLDEPLGFQEMDSTVSASLDFDFPTLPSTVDMDLLPFDITSGITSLDSLNASLYDSSNEEDQMALERAYSGVKKGFSAAHIAPFAKSRVEWSIEQLKLAPRMMVEQNGTPWQHPKLYQEEMPRPLRDAYAACALYLARNGTNDELVARYITERVEEVIESPIPRRPIEMLARAHACMLYQVMLVFGGDIRFYGQAEKLLPHMTEIATSLLPLAIQQSDPTNTLPLYPSSAAHSAWIAYILRESLRRTLLSINHFVTMCYLLRGQLVSCGHDSAIGNRVTVSAHLWSAQNAFDFAVAWNSARHFLVKDLDFTDVLRDAKPDDVDTFTKMILIGLQGIDDMKGWFYTRGGVL